MFLVRLSYFNFPALKYMYSLGLPQQTNHIYHYFNLETLALSPFINFSFSFDVIKVFRKYIKHRDLILEDIFASLARLPSSKRTLRGYRFVKKFKLVKIIVKIA